MKTEHKQKQGKTIFLKWLGAFATVVVLFIAFNLISKGSQPRPRYGGFSPSPYSSSTD